MKYSASDGRLQVVDSRRTEIDTAASVRGKIIRANERLPAAILHVRADFLSMLVDLDDGVRVVACHEQVASPEGDETGGAAFIFGPEIRGALSVPLTDAWAGVLDVQEFPILP